MRGAGRAQRVLPTPLQPADCPAEPAENLVRETGIKGGECSQRDMDEGWEWMEHTVGPHRTKRLHPKAVERIQAKPPLPSSRWGMLTYTSLHSLPGLSHCGACLLTELPLPLSPGMACFQGCFLPAHPAHPAWRQASLSLLLCGSPLCPSRLQPSLPSLLSSVSGFRWQ